MPSTKDHIGYTMTADVRVIRRKHTVVFRIGARAVDFISSLKSVPAEAVVDEVIGDEGNGLCSIEFHEEKLDVDS